MRDCDIGSAQRNDGRVTKPKLYEGALLVRLRPGFRGRMDATRGATRILDYAREIMELGQQAKEAQIEAAKKGKP